MARALDDRVALGHRVLLGHLAHGVVDHHRRVRLTGDEEAILAAVDAARRRVLQHEVHIADRRRVGLYDLAPDGAVLEEGDLRRHLGRGLPGFAVEHLLAERERTLGPLRHVHQHVAFPVAEDDEVLGGDRGVLGAGAVESWIGLRDVFHRVLLRGQARDQTFHRPRPPQQLELEVGAGDPLDRARTDARLRLAVIGLEAQGPAEMVLRAVLLAGRLQGRSEFSMAVAKSLGRRLPLAVEHLRVLEVWLVDLRVVKPGLGLPRTPNRDIAELFAGNGIVAVVLGEDLDPHVARATRKAILVSQRGKGVELLGRALEPRHLGGIGLRLGWGLAAGSSHEEQRGEKKRQRLVEGHGSQGARGANEGAR